MYGLAFTEGPDQPRMNLQAGVGFHCLHMSEGTVHFVTLGLYLTTRYMDCYPKIILSLA